MSLKMQTRLNMKRKLLIERGEEQMKRLDWLSKRNKLLIKKSGRL